jgi:hypothetical protein
MIKIIGFGYIVGAIFDPILTKKLTGQAIDTIHNLFQLVIHHAATIH